MKRKLLLLIAIILVTAGLFIFIQVLFSVTNNQNGGIQITANIKSKVFLDGQYIGDTPLAKNSQGDSIKVGQYDLRIEPKDTTYSAFTSRIKVNSGVLTAVDRTFLPGSLASATILTLEKTRNQKAELFISTIPEGAMVTIDSNPTGATPLSDDSLSESEHEIEIQKQGFAKKTIRVSTKIGYKLIVSSYLGTEGDGTEQLPSNTTPTPPTGTISPSPSEEEAAGSVTILDTPNGFLRVRSGAGTTFSEVGRVTPGKEYDLISEEEGWYEIQVDDSISGWISSQYAEKQ